MANLLIEIGVEEMPLASLDVVYGELKAKAARVFEESRLGFDDIKVEATPRRIALSVSNLDARQKDQMLEVKGPSVEKAYDADGKPTKALEGFLRGKNAKLSDIKIKDLPKGQGVFLEQFEKGLPAEKVLPELLASLFKSLSFPKLMRWEASGFKFPRPIRWIVALLDSKVLSGFELAGVKAGKVSRGHRFLSPANFSLTSADWNAYLKALKKAHVLLEIEEREEKIRKDLAEKYAQKNPDEELVHLSAQLVEEPFLLDGGFEKEYLDLPGEVLATCMKKHQKIFAVYGPKGKLKNQFVAVLNGKRKGLPRIQFDYENVLESRLHDARYFFLEDKKSSLESHLGALEQLMYLGDLGSLRDKISRMENIAGSFAKNAGHEKLTNDLKRVVTLAKTDLMTSLVYEFAELQGIAGREYAKIAGENAEVAAAIGMQYLPKNLAEDYKILKKEVSVLGALFGILDRLDLLVGAFSIGLEPSGSQDPYALRRAGGSIVKLVRAHQLSFSISSLTKEISAAYDKVGLSKKEKSQPADKVAASLNRFLKERTVFELKLKPGSRDFEIFEAVWQANSDDLADVFDRFECLKSIYKKDETNFMRAGKVVERTHNITKAVKSQLEAPKADLLEAPEEKALFELLKAQGGAISEKIQSRSFQEATRLFGETFFEPVNAFFDQVMVNVEDMKIRENRQSLMKSINDLYTRQLADLSVLSRLDK